MVTLKWKTIVIGLAVLLGVGFIFKSCGEKPNFPEPELRLKDTEKAKVIIKDNIITTVTEYGVKTEYLPRRADIILGKDGTITVRVKKKGWTFEPGMGGFVDSQGLNLSLDIGWAYYKRWQALSGLGYSSSKSVSLWGGVGYMLPFKYTRNTSAYLGYNTRQSVLVGLRVRF